MGLRGQRLCGATAPKETRLDLGVGYALNNIGCQLSQSKSDRGPESWMPPANRCRYIEIWTAMRIRWGCKSTAPSGRR